MIIVIQNDTIQKKTRNKLRSKIKIKHWIIRAVELYELCNLRFADDIDLVVGSNTELQELSNKL